MNKQDLVTDLDNAAKALLELSKEEPNTDFSKVFIILAHNYASLSLDASCTKMLNEVPDKYIEESLANDMAHAVSCKNKDTRRVNSGLITDPHLNNESEFFICAVLMLPRLSHRPSFDACMQKIATQSFEVETNTSPGLKLIKMEH